MYYEDVHWCYNAKTMNVVLDVVNESIVYHNQMHNVTFMLKLYAIRNRIKFCINFIPWFS